MKTSENEVMVEIAERYSRENVTGRKAGDGNGCRGKARRDRRM